MKMMSKNGRAIVLFLVMSLMIPVCAMDEGKTGECVESGSNAVAVGIACLNSAVSQLNSQNRQDKESQSMLAVCGEVWQEGEFGVRRGIEGLGEVRLKLVRLVHQGEGSAIFRAQKECGKSVN